MGDDSCATSDFGMHVEVEDREHSPRCAGAFAACSRSAAALLPESVSEELASMRSQLDEALREHRRRQERLVERLVEQAAAGLYGKEVAVAQPMALQVARSAPALGTIEGPLGRSAASRDSELAAPTPTVVTRVNTFDYMKKDTQAKPSLLYGQSLAVEVVDLLDDMKAKQAMRGPGRRDGAQRAASCSESCEIVFEHCTLWALEWASRAVQVKEPPRAGRLAGLLRSKYWGFLVSFMISFNAVFMIFQVDFQARHYYLEVETPLSMKRLEVGLVMFFMVELVLRLVVHRAYYFCNEDLRWNLFDFFLVLISLYDLVITYFGQDAGGNLTFFRSLRILRMTRVLRVLRVLKFAGQLRRMLLSILGSMSSLFWAFVVLLFVLYMVGLLTVQSLSSKLLELPSRMSPEEAAAVEADVLVYFGSVSSAMLTYYSATAGGEDWIIYYNLLSSVSEFDGAVLICVVVFMQIALFNVLTGIFVENAMKVGKPDRDSLALEHRREQLREGKALRSFLQDKVDVDCSGTITFEEFKMVAKNPRMNAVFSSMGLDVRDAGLFFEMMNKSDEDAALDIDFLVDAFMNMKGPATSLDVQSLLYKIDQLHLRFDGLTSAAAPADLSAAPKVPGPQKCTL